MRKGIRVTVYVVFALTVLYFVVEWFLEAKIWYFVEKKVEEVSQGAVRAEIGSVSLRLIGRSLWLEGVKITSDTVALRRSGWPLKRVEGYFDRLGARGVHFRNKDSLFYLRARELDAGISRLAADILKPGSGGRSAARTLAGVQVEVETVSVRLDRMYCRVIEGRDSVDYRLNGFSLIINKINAVHTTLGFQRIRICQPRYSQIGHRIGVHLTETIFKSRLFHSNGNRPIHHCTTMKIQVTGSFRPIQMRMHVKITAHYNWNTVGLCQQGLKNRQNLMYFLITCSLHLPSQYFFLGFIRRDQTHIRKIMQPSIKNTDRFPIHIYHHSAKIKGTYAVGKSIFPNNGITAINRKIIRNEIVRISQ